MTDDTRAEIEQAQKSMTADEFAELHADMPDGAFWALAEEHGLEPEDFAQ